MKRKSQNRSQSIPNSRNKSLAAFRSFKLEIAKDKKQRNSAHKKAITRLRLKQKRLGVQLAQVGQPLNILALGDSWFDYPLSDDVLDWLKDIGNPQPVINRQAHWGDPAMVLMGDTFRRSIIEQFQDTNQGSYDALLISAGGDDVAGDPFILWLLDAAAGMSPTNAINTERLNDILGIVKGAYQDIVTVRDRYAPNCNIFVHAYDFAIPNGDHPLCAGPWLQPSLNDKGWTNPTQARQIVRIILTQFSQMLLDLQTRFGANGKFVCVPTQGTLQAGDWANELHPSENGFKLIAEVFLQSLQTQFPGRI